MDWNQSTMYEQRVRFILEVQQRTFSFAESCRRYGISRTAGYTWWTRFLAEGFEGLHDRSHRPHHCPHAIADPIVEHVVDLRQRYGWGSRKIRKLTAEKFGEAPARRTIVLDVFVWERSVEAREAPGGTARKAVLEQITAAETCLQQA